MSAALEMVDTPFRLVGGPQDGLYGVLTALALPPVLTYGRLSSSRRYEGLDNYALTDDVSNGRRVYAWRDATTWP